MTDGLFGNLKDSDQKPSDQVAELVFQIPNNIFNQLIYRIRISRFMDIQCSVFEFHLLRIAKFTHGVRQFIAAFNDGIYSVQSECREMNFAKHGGNELPHSKERCHAHKSKIHAVGCSVYLNFVIRYSAVRYSIVQELHLFGRLIKLGK